MARVRAISQLYLLAGFATLLHSAKANTSQSSRRRDPSPTPAPPVVTDFWAAHILNEYFTGPANKDLGNLECDVGFVAFYCFGQQPQFSNFNSEEHVDHTVFEQVLVHVHDWGQYLSCCPPKAKTNPGEYYRCNSWTTEANDNCHTTGLPWNDGKVTAVGAVVPHGSKPVGGKKQWMWSFPAEGEGVTWRQSTTRRVKMSDLGKHWAQKAGGCAQCQGKDLEDPCYGKCISTALDTPTLIGLTNSALKDFTNFPNYGIPGTEGIMFAGTKKCMDLSGGDSTHGTAIDLWDCNGLVNQAWYWGQGTYNIELGGHNLPGMCIDLPGGTVENGNKLQLWQCNGENNQKWSWDSATSAIQYTANTKYCIDLPGGDTSNGNQLWLWECTGGNTQKWFIYTRSGAASLGASAPEIAKPTVGGKKPRRYRSWMHEITKFLSSTDWNWTKPAGFVPWHEDEKVKDWYAAQMPGPGLPRPLVPPGWQGYNISADSDQSLV